MGVNFFKIIQKIESAFMFILLHGANSLEEVRKITGTVSPMLRISLAVSMPFNNGMMMSRKIRSTGIVRRAVNRSSPLEYGYRVSEKSFFSAQ